MNTKDYLIQCDGLTIVNVNYKLKFPRGELEMEIKNLLKKFKSTVSPEHQIRELLDVIKFIFSDSYIEEFDTFDHGLRCLIERFEKTVEDLKKLK